MDKNTNKYFYDFFFKVLKIKMQRMLSWFFSSSSSNKVTKTEPIKENMIIKKPKEI